MCPHRLPPGIATAGTPFSGPRTEERGPVRTDGGEDRDDDGGDTADDDGVDRSTIEITDAGEAEPADPKWEKPDPEDIPEFEVSANRPLASGRSESRSGDEPTAGMPNTARSPGQARIKEEGTEGYIVALELCARLPDDIRLPEEAAELVPAAVEAELEDDIQSFAAAEFDNPAPAVDVLTFEEVDDEIWLRLRLGVPSGSFADLDPDTIRSYALQELEGVF